MPMSPRLLRPRASGATHRDALDWATRVTTNGGTFTSNTLAAVSTFCAAIDAAGIRDRFFRLNLLCGDGLTAALVPLYRAESLTASARGNTTDTNNNFVAADFNNTGSSSGLSGNGSSKFLNTGLPSNGFTFTDVHMGIGLLSTDTQTGYRLACGAFRSGYDLSISIRRSDGFDAISFGANATQKTGGPVLSSALSVGNIVGAYPSAYRNASAFGTAATSAASSSTADSMFVFAINDAASAAATAYTNARIGWYSFGRTMTSAQVTSFNNALVAFASTLART